MIAHVDIDAFFASVEQRLVPALRGRPVAVGSGCIASCSYEARRLGLHAGMSLGRARQLCPALVVLPGSQGIYRCFAAEIWEICRDFAAGIETHLDDAYLDLSGMERIYPDPPAAFERLRARVRAETGLAVTVGLGPNRMIARLAGKAAKPDGLRMVRAAEVEGFLLDRPVADLPGIGPRHAELLRRLNVRTIRELQALPEGALAALFGKLGLAFYERARGRDSRPVHAREIPRTISRETTFHRETSDPVEIRAMLHYLVERAMKAVRELGLGARIVGLGLRYCDYRSADGARRLAAPTDLEGPVYAAVLELLPGLHARRVALRHVGVALSGLALRDESQLLLFAPAGADPRDERLASALDDIRRRFGFSAITAGPSLDLLGKLAQDANGYVLRTPCLTK
jgi:DNA polymerase-4